MKRLLPVLSSLLVGCVALPALADPAQFDSGALNHSTAYQRGVNYRSARGVPLAPPPAGTPVGSDGRGFSGQTPSQFKSVLSGGGLVHPGPANTTALFTGGSSVTSYETNAVALGLPHNKDGNLAVVLSRAVMGAPYFNRATTVYFGQIIAPPDTDENAVKISGQRPEDYWDPEPLDHTEDPVLDRYYWSPHAGVVFGTTQGPISIKWRKAKPETNPVANAASRVAAGALVERSGNYYAVTNVPYLVSGSSGSGRQVRTMYWTEGKFGTFGKMVKVPKTKVDSIKFIFSGQFPENVDKSKVDSDTRQNGQEALPTDTSTIWSENELIRAKNATGRLFVELLGEGLPNGNRRYLGSEVVQVEKFAIPKPIAVDLGDAIAPEINGTNPEGLHPEPVLVGSGSAFLYENASSTGGDSTFYAAKATENPNDAVIHWTVDGVAGVRWPRVFASYQMGWPSDPADYEHYIRSAVSSSSEAEMTAVPLPSGSNPVVSDQDNFDSPLGGYVTGEGSYYSYLDAGHPVHRALLRFQKGNQVAFTRILSWLDAGLKNPATLSGTVATNLAGWGNQTLITATTATGPRVLSQTVPVGARIPAPLNEAGAADSYLAGHVHLAEGDSFDATAYQDPLIHGFAAANQGAIIPVNAIPGRNRLEVWWFRPQATNGVLNESNGFDPIYWPSVIGQYTLQWPAAPDEIVLASNEGSRPLPSLQAKGSIYVQNDPTAAGYNPNEEHALMLGGQAYALRDDLNRTATTVPARLTGADATYSSSPFILLRYVESDGRPAMHPFRVLREKPELGVMFDYVVQAGGNAEQGGAGKILQAPMPLPFLPPPVDESVNRNTETSTTGGDLPAGWTSWSSTLKAQLSNYSRFTYLDRKNNFWVLRGLHAGLPVLDAGTYNSVSKSFARTMPAATAVLGQSFSNVFHASRLGLEVALKPGSVAPNGLRVDGLTFSGIAVSTPGVTYPITTSLTFVIADVGDGASVEVVLPLTVASSGNVVAQGPLTLTTTSPQGAAVTFVGRPPFLAAPAKPTNSFSMRFFYKTQEGFAWPGLDVSPEVGTVVPYLRPLNGSGTPQGDPTSTTDSLDIVYRPVWPNAPPKMPFGYTLNDARFNLPAIRGQSSIEVLYQQSIATSANGDSESVVLHDPERQKTYDLRVGGLETIPGSVRTQAFQGKTYFPNLPPHLAKRFYLDPDASPLGSLVFRGEYRSAGLGAPYLLLNVLRGEDLAAVKDLCPPGDDKAGWNAAVDGLATTLETFVEDPDVKGSHIPDPALREIKGVGDLATITDANTAVASYALSANGPGQGYVSLIMNNSSNPDQTPAGDPVSVYVIQVGGTLFPGEINIIPSDNPLSEVSIFQHSLDFGGNFGDYEYEWKIAPPVNGGPPPSDQFQPLVSGAGIPRYTLGGSGIQTLVDNWIRMRYRPTNSVHPLEGQWSEWTDPQLAEGWIKRVVAGINPFNQRVTDLYNNTVNTDANILTSAGKRWEGDIALNLENINDYGLIEIYETVLKKGRGLSIDAGINSGPANDALLLAAGYLNDLYMLVGNEAYADASNPTIGIGTKNNTYGDIATALFAFKGQEPSLLEEELALLRGRDDTLVPGVEVAPVYNRLVWNYTRGIDSGEVIYALNYNILDQNDDGRVDAADAAKLYPQGHGDAYGHYLTAVKGYYSLLLNSKFSWRPTSEAVTILGKAVAVDYQDERKFATAAAAAARTGRQVFDLTWRRDYVPGRGVGWEHFGSTRESQRTVLDATGATSNPIIREWGADQWASRVEQGAFLNWVVGNAILPSVDPDPGHEGIQKVDRTTVPELKELAMLISGLQGDLDTAEGGLTPLGLSEGSLAFDIDPNLVTGANPQSHFEQVYARTKMALNNAVTAFDDAKDVTRLMRSEQDSLEEFQTEYDKQELAYNSALIEIYGTPYPDDIGAGKTWPQDYAGPDLFNYRYVDSPEFINGGEAEEGSGVDVNGNAANGVWDANGAVGSVFKVDIQATTAATSSWPYKLGTDVTIVPSYLADGSENPAYLNHVHYIEFPWGPHGFLDKPATFKGKRKSPGKLQQDISEVIAAYDHLFNSVTANMVSDKEDLDKSVQLFNALESRLKESRSSFVSSQEELLHMARLERFRELANIANEHVKETFDAVTDGISLSVPEVFIAGLAAGGSVGSVVQGLALFSKAGTLGIMNGINYVVNVGVLSELDVTDKALQKLSLEAFDLDQTDQLQQAAAELGHGIKQVQGDWILINKDTRALQDAYEKFRADLAAGDRLQVEREVFRKRAAAVVQGFRTRDAAFRIFRSEKLDRYKALFDLAARYSYLAANAYDYETGLLNTDAGQAFINRIVSARALGVVKNGEPQFGGSNSGDPGLSSALAEMKGDWDVLRGRLGFNNPDAYGTTVSLRQEDLRILTGADGDSVWEDVLQRSVRANLLEDTDVRRHCLQIDPGTGLPVPGIVLEFTTSINPGHNLFGRPLASGDSAFHRSSFATKIYAAGVALEGYVGMNNPVANGSAVGGTGAISPVEPASTFLNPDALAATPYVYLIPVGMDAMRSPPLGDASEIRTWEVQDVTIPMPFNIGASDFSSKKLYQTADSLSEPLFGVRKHQAFRPVSTTSAFSADIYGLGGSLQPSQFTNRRLIGRSIWNSRWKLVIPGDSLLQDPKEGLSRFIKNVKDVKLHFVTYSYSGN